MESWTTADRMTHFWFKVRSSDASDLSSFSVAWVLGDVPKWVWSKTWREIFPFDEFANVELCNAMWFNIFHQITFCIRKNEHCFYRDGCAFILWALKLLAYAEYPPCGSLEIRGILLFKNSIHLTRIPFVTFGKCFSFSRGLLTLVSSFAIESI